MGVHTVRVALRVSCRNTLRRYAGRLVTVSCYRRRTARRSVHLIIYGLSFRSGTNTLLLMIYFCFWRVAGTVILMTGVKDTRGMVTVSVLIVKVDSGFLL
jgi:hypothetical protein